MPPAASLAEVASINGTAEASATVRLYTNSSCSGAVSASGSASAAGAFSIGVAVSRNTTTTFFAALLTAAQCEALVAKARSL